MVRNERRRGNMSHLRRGRRRRHGEGCRHGMRRPAAGCVPCRVSCPGAGATDTASLNRAAAGGGPSPTVLDPLAIPAASSDTPGAGPSWAVFRRPLSVRRSQNEKRTAGAGLGRFAWTDPLLRAGVAPVRLVHPHESRRRSLRRTRLRAAPSPPGPTRRRGRPALAPPCGWSASTCTARGGRPRGSARHHHSRAFLHRLRTHLLERCHSDSGPTVGCPFDGRESGVPRPFSMMMRTSSGRSPMMI